LLPTRILYALAQDIIILVRRCQQGVEIPGFW